VMVISETQDEREATMYEVERAPLPVLKKIEGIPQDYTARVQFLFKPKTLQ
jgi:hypothetical protein